MQIESRATETIRELPSGRRTGYISDRQGLFTSDPNGNSTGSSDEAAPEITGQGAGAPPGLVPDPTDVKAAVEKLNALVQSQKTDVRFSVDEGSHATVIRVFKAETGELIRQFPPEEILAMKAKVNQTIGWLYDMKV